MTVQSVNISLVDTFALRGYQNQPILQIHIKITGTSGNISLQKLIINSLNQSNSDIDSIAIFQTTTERFSLADYPGEGTQITSRKQLTGDSVAFSNMNFPLDTGDNYIWVMMDVDKNANGSHTLGASIRQNGIELSGNYYPVSTFTPAGTIPIMQVYYTCNFEDVNGNNQPLNWTQQITGGGSSPNTWIGHYGGYNLPFNAGYPSAPKSGKLNALLAQQASSPILVDMLISQPLDLSYAAKPTLTFYHAQVAWCKATNEQGQCTQSNSDELSVFYRIGTAGSWNLLTSYPLATPDNWTKRQIQLPDSAAQSNFYLGFQGTAQYGWGVCLDSIVLYESAVIPIQINDVVVSQPVTAKVPQSSSRNPILRVDLQIKGNSGSVNMDSLTVTSLNTSDTDVITSGVKLYSTLDSVFLSPKLVGTPVSIVNGKMRFNVLNIQLAPGDNYYWVCYDVTKNANPGDKLDAEILAGDIHCNIAGTYPANNQSPGGSSSVIQTLFWDNFSNNKGWTLTGEFQEGKPEGLGGGSGNPGPTTAYIDSSELGTDLSGTGNDQVNLNYNNAYTATSPLIDATYFKNLNLNFYRWLNIGTSDSAVIELQIQGQNNWIQIWTNQQTTITDNTWNNQNFSISSIIQNIGETGGDNPITKTTVFERNKFYLRFRLGSTGPVNVYSGWNINNLFITGDTIKKDAAVTAYYGPYSSCNLTASENIKIGVKNTGPSVINSLPVKFSLNNGMTYITETIPGPIGVNDTLDYPFSTPANFGNPAIYKVVVKVALPGDDYSPNDSIIQSITSIPNYSLPYSTNFPNLDSSFWISGGINSSWSLAVPGGGIPSPPNGPYCWQTQVEDQFNKNENSYVESPCFNFKGKEVPMIDMKNSYFEFPEDTTAGAIMEYSLDQGATWNYLPKDTLTTTNWTWYNTNVTKFNDSPGWMGQAWNSGNSLIWEQDRQLLPGTTAGNNKVKFRFHFKSGSNSIPEAGFAFTNIAIYNAPFDLGVNKLMGLVSPACQGEDNPDIKLSVKNYGKRSVHPGDTIILGVNVDALTPVIDTFYIPAGDTLKHLDTIQFRMKKPINISAAGTHQLSAYVITNTDPYFYRSVSYDTAYTTLLVNQNPVTGLPDTVYSALIDTLVLKAIDSTNYNYLWSYPPKSYTTPTDSLAISNTGSGNQYLTVTNQNTLCYTRDTVFVKVLVSDIGSDSILSPINNCGYGTDYLPTVDLKNFGTDTLRINRKIPVNVHLDGNPVQRDTITLTANWAPKTILQATLNTPLNLSVPAIHNLTVYTSLASDTIHDNDTTKSAFRIYGYPTVSLGNNVYVKALSYTIQAPTGFNTYLWNNTPLDTLDSLVVTSSGENYLTVTDQHNCPASDSIHVRLAIHDLGVKRLVSPVSSCTMPDSSVVTCMLWNAGTDTILAGDTAMLTYSVNSGATVTETLTIPEALYPHDSLSYTFFPKASLQSTGNYAILAGALISNDMNPKNDTLTSLVSVYGNPQINLGPPRNEQAYQYIIDPGSGFKSYQWQDGSTDSVYIITKTHFESPPIYWVTVTDHHNCQTSDTAIIFLVDQDLEVASEAIPPNSCTLSNSEQIGIVVKNVGNQPLSDQTVLVSYQVNGATPVESSFVFTGDTGTSVTYYFATTANLSAVGTYKIFTKIQMAGDVQPDNDTLTDVVQVWGNPLVNFGADTFKVGAWPYTLDAGAGNGYTYQWSNGDTTETIGATADGWYAVRVTSINGCQGTNTVYLQKNVSSLSVAGLMIPSAGCTFPDDQVVGIKISNSGNMALLNQEATITYQINAEPLVSQNITFTGNPKDTASYQFSQTANLSAITTYEFTITCNYPGNADSSHNNQIYEVIAYGLPVINFGVPNDTIKASAFPVILNPGTGFASYEWDNNINLNSPTYSASHPGYYSVKVTDAYHCSNKDSVYVDKVTAVNQVTEDNNVSIYPNPARDAFYIDISQNSNYNSIITIELFTSDGKPVMSRILSGNALYHEMVEVNTLAKGMYYLRIQQSNTISTHKVIVQ